MQIVTLTIKFSFNGKEDTLYPIILHNKNEVILVDCGYAGFMPLIEEAAKQQGFTLNTLTGIIITHHDIDHMGGLAEIKAAFPDLKIYSSEVEKPYINGDVKSLRLQQAEELYPNLPEEQKPEALQFQDFLKTVQPVVVDQTFSENEKPSYLPDIQIINTPGHMPGHISIYLPNDKTLIAADALVVENNQLEIANPRFTLDLPAAIASVTKFQQLDIEKIICYHGGIVEGDIQKKLAELIFRYSIT